MLFKKKETAIVTLAAGDKYEKILKQTFPLMKEYSRRIGSSLLIDRVKDESLKIPYYQKLSTIYRALESFERVAWIDVDILISRKAPSIFKEVPEGKIGIFNEGLWTLRERARDTWFNLTKFKIPDNIYYNAGVIVADQMHRDIFRKPIEMIDHYGDQTYLNQKILQSGYPVHDLSHHWNRMANTNTLGEDPYLSHFIHFAGMDTPTLPLIIEEHRRKWEDMNWTGKKSIVIVCANGMGNQIATIPVVEYFAELHPEYDIYVHSFFPEVFKHLESDQIKVIQPGEATPRYALWLSTAKMETITEVGTHPLDYHSISLLKRQLPLSKRRIRYPSKKILPCLPTKTVVIHAGKSGWKSKEAPQTFWYNIVVGLKRKGFPVAMIGKKDWSGVKKGYGAHYFPDCDYDFTDRSLGETADVIRCGWMLLSNDSMPVHLAGAFDNYIGLVTIAKRPELILPYRNGTQDFKTISWTGKPLWDVVKEPLIMPPNQTFDWADWHDGMEFPEPKQIVEDIANLASAARLERATYSLTASC